MQQISSLWRKNVAGKLVVVGGGIVTMCCACSALLALVPTPAAPPGASAGATRAPSATVAPTNTPGPTATPAPTDIPPTPTPRPADTATPTAAESIEQIARKRCRGNFISAQYSDKRTEIECKLPESLTDNMMVTAAFINAFELTRDIMQSGQPMGALRIQLIGDFTDKYGNPMRLPAMTFLITRETADKINWPNMLHNSFGKLIVSEPDGSTFAVHPAWRDNVRAWLAD